MPRSNAVPHRLDVDAEIPNTITFETDNQTVYEVRFRSSDYLFPALPELTGSAFEFVLALLGSPAGLQLPPDPRIVPTVVGPIDHFLQNDPMRVVAYICDSSDR